jgi:predicted phage terminase large subunit-like protein
LSDRALPVWLDILRNDFAAFTSRTFRELKAADNFSFNWHIEAVCSKLEAVRRGEIKRLIINLPPRQGKSIIGSVAFPAFVLGHNPKAEILCVSYGQDLADDFADSCRTLISSPFYQAAFKTRLSATRQKIDDYRTTEDGARRSTSLLGGITGRGADLIIIDDPIKADDAQSDARRTTANASFYNTLYSRLNHKETGAIVIIMQRLHMDDLVGYVTQRERWEVLALPAVAEEDERYEIITPYGLRSIVRREGEAMHPDRESLARLKELRASMSEYVFAAQYQQQPQPAAGFIVKTKWFKYYEPREIPDGGTLLQSWDTANKDTEGSDFSVCTTWRYVKRHFWLIDVFRDRMEFPELKRKVKELANLFRADVVLIEDRASGTQLIQELRHEGVAVRAAPIQDGSKMTRLNNQTAKFESGFVHLPRHAPWLDSFVLELTTFPNARFDDQVDSAVHALAWDTEQLNSSFENAMGWLQLQEQAATDVVRGAPSSRPGSPLSWPIADNQLVDIYRETFNATRSNHGLRCRNCGEPMTPGGTRITDGIDVWHPTCPAMDEPSRNTQ